MNEGLSCSQSQNTRLYRENSYNICSPNSLSNLTTPRSRKVQKESGNSYVVDSEYFYNTRQGKPIVHKCEYFNFDNSPIIDDFSIRPEDVEPNVHHDDIMTEEVECDVINEMEENEIFAREAGINFSKVGGDYLCAKTSDTEAQSDLYEVNLSPKHNLTHEFTDVEDGLPPNATFLKGRHKDMFDDNSDLSQLRILAGYLNQQWTETAFIAPTLARRVRDFQFAQEKRHKKFGNERPWGVLGLYDHLASVRMDVDWADEAAYRRANGEPYYAWSEFVESKKRGYNRPFFVYLSMTICSIFMLLTIIMNGWKFESFRSNPMIGPSAETLVAMGAKDSFLIVQKNQLWRIISPIVLHAGLIHFTMNMLAIWVIGGAVEQCHGFVRVLLLFFISAIGGNILSAVFLPDYISVGASGGIFGLIGVCLADIVMNWKLLFSDFVNKGKKNRHIFILLFLFLDILVNLIIGLTPFVDNFGHVGGMTLGFICGLSILERVSTLSTGDRDSTGEFKPVKEYRGMFFFKKRKFFQLFGIIITVAGLTTSLAVLLRGDGMTTPCYSCTVLSCVSFPPWASIDNKWWYC